MDRQFKEIVTPKGGHKVTLKAWLTGREKRNIQAVYLQDVDLKASQGGAAQEYKISGGKFYEAQNVAINTLVVSVDGSKEGVLEKVLDMRAVDFDFLVAEINKLTSGEEEASDLKGRKESTPSS